MKIVDANALPYAVNSASEHHDASRTWLDRMRAEPARNGHVLLMRTLSKFGLAGVRIGYLLGEARLIAQLDKVRPPYNVSVLNAECALFALEHAEVGHGGMERLRRGAQLGACPDRLVEGALEGDAAFGHGPAEHGDDVVIQGHCGTHVTCIASIRVMLWRHSS